MQAYDGSNDCEVASALEHVRLIACRTLDCRNKSFAQRQTCGAGAHLSKMAASGHREGCVCRGYGRAFRMQVLLNPKQLRAQSIERRRWHEGFPVWLWYGCWIGRAVRAYEWRADAPQPCRSRERSGRHGARNDRPTS